MGVSLGSDGAAGRALPPAASTRARPEPVFRGNKEVPIVPRFLLVQREHRKRASEDRRWHRPCSAWRQARNAT